MYVCNDASKLWMVSRVCVRTCLLTVETSDRYKACDRFAGLQQCSLLRQSIFHSMVQAYNCMMNIQ